MPLIDSDALLNAGLDAGKAYLGSPRVVDAILRDALQRVAAIRADQLKTGADPMPEIRSLAAELQRTFYGQDPSFLASAWNSPGSLGEALVNQCGVGGDIEDAAERAAIRMVREFLSDLVAHEHDALDEPAMHGAIDALLGKYTAIFVGSADAR